ncbi:MAG: hypothetical protein ACR2N0_03060 [Rubrobacteraceae bacterium]
MRGGFRDESGIALGLAVMVVVVVGIMGAGLLVFVRNDLASVVRANQGQSAFYAADAGAESAKRELLGDASSASYDADDASGACDSPLDADAPISSEWAVGEGAERSFEGGGFVASIRWLGSGCGFPSGGDPDSEYFEVVSTGTSGEAKRRIEAVYAASDANAPLANYAVGDVRIGDTAVVDGVSVFSGGDVEIEAADSLRGADEIYGDWRSDGETARLVEEAGVGAVGAISGDTSEVGTRDFDETSAPPFVGESPEGELSFPFDPDNWRSRSALEFLKEEATAQGNYRDSGGSLPWPDDSTESTVVYVEFGELSGSVELSSAVCEAASECRGVLVVENGSATVESGAVFRGAVVAAGGEGAESSSVVVEEGATVEGSIASSGTMEIFGEIRGAGRKEAVSRPGFHAMEIWGWRELYE